MTNQDKIRKIVKEWQDILPMMKYLFMLIDIVESGSLTEPKYRLYSIETAQFLISDEEYKKIYGDIDFIKALAEWNPKYPLTDEPLANLRKEYLSKLGIKEK